MENWKVWEFDWSRKVGGIDRSWKMKTLTILWNMESEQCASTVLNNTVSDSFIIFAISLVQKTVNFVAIKYGNFASFAVTGKVEEFISQDPQKPCNE